MSLSQHICNHIADTIGGDNSLGDSHNVFGGDINQARRLVCGGSTYFVKTNQAYLEHMFAAEALGLQEMADSNTIRVPRPVCWGTHGDSAYLVMENLSLGGSGSGKELAQQLAAMHHVTQPHFGWHTENTIGATRQVNTPAPDWVAFWRDHRLGFQLDLAGGNGFGYLLPKGEQLMDAFPALFESYQPVASMLHGDLWSGNYGFTAEGDPVIYDPAFYYGDREADIAMTELFGGFGRDFYAAYNNAWPMDPGYKTRKTFYNLYHILNHANMFGGGYASQAQRMIESLLSELR